MKYKAPLRVCLMLLLSLCTALSLCMYMPVPDGLYYAPAEVGAMENVLDSLRLSLQNSSLLSSFIFIAALFLWRYNERRRGGRYLCLGAVCAVISVIWLMGQNFAYDDSLNFLLCSPGQKLKSLIYILGSFNLLLQCGIAADGFLGSERDIPLKDGAIAGFLRRRPYWGIFALLFVCALPTWIICYPGYMAVDPYIQLGNYFGIEAGFNANHPLVHTLLLAWCVKLGLALGDANYGIFSFVSLQMLCCIAVFSYALYTMQKLRAPKWLLIGSFLVIAINPNFVPMAAYAIKDTLFSYGVLLMIIEFCCLIDMGFDYWDSPRHCALFALAVLDIALLRNGIRYLLFAVLCLLAIMLFIRARRGGKMKSAAKAAAVMLLPALFSIVMLSLLMSAYKVIPGSRRESRSVPFQQTARYVVECYDELTAEEIEIIDRVLDFEGIVEKYDPAISDPVKDTFKENCTDEELSAYMKLWLRQGLRHPNVYFKAFMNQNYYLFCPFKRSTINWQHGRSTDFNLWNEYSYRVELGIHEVDVADSLEQLMRQGDYLLVDLPVTGFFSHPSTSFLILLLLYSLAIKRRLRRFMLLALPALLTLLVIFATPTIDPRYTFPAMYSMPLLIAFYCREAGGLTGQAAAAVAQD